LEGRQPGHGWQSAPFESQSVVTKSPVSLYASKHENNFRAVPFLCNSDDELELRIRSSH
jgi:hypothetical protein